MIEHLFDSGTVRAPEVPPADGRIGCRNSARNRRNRTASPGVYRAMKRDSARLLAATIRTGLMVGLALILILILLPAALAAQAAGLR